MTEKWTSKWDITKGLKKDKKEKDWNLDGGPEFSAKLLDKKAEKAFSFFLWVLSFQGREDEERKD